jgi:hypothetical protein
MNRGRFFFPLVALLAALLLWVFLTDRPVPATPDGNFVPLVLLALFSVGVTWLIATAVRQWWK